MKKKEKKIIYIANVRIPTEKAHGLQISKMCEQFAERGYEVELWVPSRKNNINTDVFSFYNIKNNFKIKKVFCLDLFFLEKFIGPFSFWVEFASFYFFVLIKSAFLSPRTVIYTREPLVCLFKIFFFQIVFECHSISEKKKSFFFLVRFAKRIITISSGLKKIFLENGFKEEQIFISPDAVDLSVFDIGATKEEARRKLNLPTDQQLIIYTGKFKTMGMDKGISDILKSLVFLPEDIIFLAVGGSKDDIAQYQKQAEDLEIGNRVKLVGHVSQSELAIYQKAADILLMPFPFNQHYAYYMSPLKMFEYMAAKRPIIASNLPSIKEVLNSQNSCLCQPDNPKDLSEKISLILDNKTLGESLSEQAYSDVKNYTWEKRAEGILGFIGR
ncbi:MAG: glycosyltransferase [Patescibacteria group bacterium]